MRYVWSVTPSLLAWPALLYPEPLNFAVLIASFGGAYAVDARYASLGLLGPPVRTPRPLGPPYSKGFMA